MASTSGIPLMRSRALPDRVKLEVYLTTAERCLLTEVAEAAQLSTSSWVRRVACDVARQEQDRLARAARRRTANAGRRRA